MTTPTLAGLHHLKLPVSDLDASLGWYERVLGASRLPQFDHVDGTGQRYAVGNITMPAGDPEPDDPWLSPPSMRHPGPVQALP